MEQPEVRGSAALDATEQFATQIEGEERDGIVTREEFSDYYHDVAGAIASDAASRRSSKSCPRRNSSNARSSSS